jgi:hypothetical protein
LCVGRAGHGQQNRNCQDQNWHCSFLAGCIKYGARSEEVSLVRRAY